MRGEGLHKQFPKEYSAWKNMKSRAAARGDTVAPEFIEFSSFLQHMGPLPEPTYSLDQIDRRKKLYSPTNAQWADKRTQSNNRSNTILIIYEGKATPIAEVARLTGQSADTLRRRFQRGWSNADIIGGRPQRSQRRSSIPPIIRRPVEVIDNLAEARWLQDEAEIHEWLDMYHGEDETEFGSYPYNEERLPFLEFVLQQSEKAIELLRGGNPAGLIPPLRAVMNLSAGERMEWARRLDHASMRAFQQILKDRFLRDKLVDPCTLNQSISVTWHTRPQMTDTDYRDRHISMRRAAAIFQQQGKTLPPVLAAFVAEIGDRRLM